MEQSGREGTQSCHLLVSPLLSLLIGLLWTQTKTGLNNEEIHFFTSKEVQREWLLLRARSCGHLDSFHLNLGSRQVTTTLPEEEEEAFLELPCSPSQVLVPRTGSHARSRSPHWPDAWDWHTQCRLITIPPANQEQRQGLPCLLHGGRNTLDHNQDSIGWEGGGSGCGVSLQLGWPCQGESLCHHITSGCQNELLPMSLTPGSPPSPSFHHLLIVCLFGALFSSDSMSSWGL